MASDAQLDLPDGWSFEKIDDLFESWGGHTPSKANSRYWGEGLPWVSPKDVKATRLSGGTLTVTQEAIDKTGLKICPAGSVLVVVRSGILAHTLPVAIVERPVAINQDLKAFYSDAPFMNEWLALFLSMNERDLLASSRRDGTTVQSVQYPLLKATRIPVPPLTERRRIIEAIENALDKQRSIRPRLAAAKRLSSRLRRSILVAACSGRLTDTWRDGGRNTGSAKRVIDSKRRKGREQLGARYRPQLLPDPGDLPEIPESWTWAALPELGELGRGKSKHRPRNDPRLYGGTYPFVQTGDVARSGGRVTTHSQTYNEAGLAQSRLWPERTVCITIAANIAESALLTYPACFPDSVVGLIADETAALPEYVELFIRTARRDLAAYAPATAQANINLAILSEVAVALPPIEEQREIVKRVDELYALCGKIESSIDTAVRGVDRSSQAVLAKAFRGRLLA